MKKEFIVALMALIAQISGIISVLAIIGVFMGAPDAKTILFITAPLFFLSFLVTTKMKGGISWLIAWSLPWPF